MKTNGSLANRLAVSACRDLTASAPTTISAAKPWLDQCGFWLAELSTCAKTPDQLPFMVGLLSLSIHQSLKWPLKESCQALKEWMNLYQLAIIKEAKP